MNLKIKILIVFLIVVFAVTAGCTSENTTDNNSKDQTNQNGDSQNNQNQFEMTNGQGIVNDNGVPQAHAFNDSQLEKMEIALTNGVKIDDPQYDWNKIPDELPPGEIDNTHPYPLNWTDIRSVSFGADEDYIYFKFQFWGNLPREAVTYNGDLIKDAGTYIGEIVFGTGYNDIAQFQSTVSYVEPSNKSQISEIPWLSHDAMISPTGETDASLDTIYEEYTREGLIGGGADTDYLITAYPLKLLNLKLGDTVTFCLGTETHSTVYHHCAKDQILGNTSTKRGPDLKYVLGSNTYEDLGVPSWAYDPELGEIYNK